MSVVNVTLENEEYAFVPKYSVWVTKTNQIVTSTEKNKKLCNEAQRIGYSLSVSESRVLSAQNKINKIMTQKENKQQEDEHEVAAEENIVLSTQDKKFKKKEFTPAGKKQKEKTQRTSNKLSVKLF